MTTDTDLGRHPLRPTSSLVLDVHRTASDRVVVTASGELCAFGAPAVASRLRPAVDAARLLVVDLRDVTFFAAAGARVLVELRRLADDRGVAVELAPSPQVRRVLTLAGLDELFPLVDDVDPPDPEVDLRDRLVPTAPADAP
jgi:anti-anti-sigma factor